MRGIAANEGASAAKPVGDQPAADPVFPAQDLVFELGPDTEDRADRAIPVDRLEGFVFAIEMVVNEPGLAMLPRCRSAVD